MQCFKPYFGTSPLVMTGNLQSYPGEAILIWVYFIQSSAAPHLVKIGRTTRNPRVRLSALQSGSPVELRPVLYLRGNVGLEGLLHMLFGAYRTHGEWFYPRGRLAEFIKECRSRKVTYVGPKVRSEMLEDFVEPEHREAILPLLNAIDKHHEQFMVRYPWLRGQDIEKLAPHVLTSP